VRNKALNQWDNLEEHIDSMGNKLKNQFEYKVIKKGSRKVEFNQTETLNEISDKIKHIYKTRLDEWLRLVPLTQIDLVFVPFSFVFIVLSAFYYLKKYLNCDFYQNYVISAKFHQLNENRQMNGNDSVLPLKEYLKFRYVDLYELKMSAIEFKNTYRSYFTLCLTLLPVFIVLGLDASLIRVTQFVHNNMLYEMNAMHEQENLNLDQTQIEVNGSGFLADSLYKPMLETKSDLDEDEGVLSNKHCFPFTHQQSSPAYELIKNYFIIITILTFGQSYFKRFRSVCAGCCFPERDEERAFWLFNHIRSLQAMLGSIDSSTYASTSASDSSSFSAVYHLKKIMFEVVYFILNFLFQIFMSIGCCCYCFCLLDRISLKNFIVKNQNHILFISGKIFTQKVKCLKCGLSEDDLNDLERDLTKCTTPDCLGIFCVTCYNELSNTCKYCRMVLIADVITDIEHDSSSDDDDEDYAENIFTDLNQKEDLNFSYQQKIFQNKKNMPNESKSPEQLIIIDVSKENMLKIIDCYLKSFYEAKLKTVNLNFLKKFQINLQDLKDSENTEELLKFVLMNFIRHIKLSEYFELDAYFFDSIKN